METQSSNTTSFELTKSVPASAPKPITLLIWDRPSEQELRRPSFRGCSDTLRILSGLPPYHSYSPSSWITSLVVHALTDMRSFDPQVKVISVAFACSTVHAAVCIAVKGGPIFSEHRASLSWQIGRGLELLWEKHGDLLYQTTHRNIAKITPVHVRQCVDMTL